MVETLGRVDRRRPKVEEFEREKVNGCEASVRAGRDESYMSYLAPHGRSRCRSMAWWRLAASVSSETPRPLYPCTYLCYTDQLVSGCRSGSCFDFWLGDVMFVEPYLMIASPSESISTFRSELRRPPQSTILNVPSGGTVPRLIEAPEYYAC